MTALLGRLRNEDALRPIDWTHGLDIKCRNHSNRFVTMVLGILTAVAACPAIIGTTEAVRQGQKKNAKEKHRGQKANLVVSCPNRSSHSAQIEGGLVVLRNNKVCTFTCNDHYC